MSFKTELEELQFECSLKAKNLKTATESIEINRFKDTWHLSNYLLCLKESEEITKKLIAYLEASGI